MSGSINEAEGPRPQRDPSASCRWCGRLGPLLIAVIAFFAIRPSLDAVGERPDSADAPGLTLDEIFNIQTGAYLWRSLILEGPGYFTPSGADRVFNQPLANPDHPPLGRLAIGVAHDLLRSLVGGNHPDIAYSVTSARYSSALLFAFTVWLVGWYSARWFGTTSGLVAAAALALMPRAFGHAHLAALETAIGLIFTGTVLYVADSWSPVACRNSDEAVDLHQCQSPPWLPVSVAGVLLGLALLTKIQTILLPIPIGLWALWQWRWRAILPMLVFGLIGVAVFFLGWPWLWLDPIGHTLQYLGRTTNRPTLYCHYLGQRYADVNVPWHYSLVVFLVTVPVGLHVIGCWGLWRTFHAAWRKQPAPASGAGSCGHESRSMLIATVVLFVLTFFALPGITVYDGERLFLVVFPLWSVLIGYGMSSLGHRFTRGWTVAAVLLAAGIGEGFWGLVQFEPCHLSYYNLAVGGLSGADRLGFEPTYWRDSFTRGFLEEVSDAVPEGSTLYIAPVLHPANRIDLPLLSPLLRERRLQTDAYDDKDPAKRDMRYVLVFRRHADPWDALEPAPIGANLLCEVLRDGVQLAALYDLRSRQQPPTRSLSRPRRMR